MAESVSSSSETTIPCSSTSPTIRLTSRNSNPMSGPSNGKTESAPLLPSPSHQHHYVQLLTSDDHSTISPSTATLRPTVTTTESMSSSPTSSTKDRASLIQIELPESFTKRDKVKEGSCWKSFFAFVFVFANMTINLIVLAIIHERVPRSQPALPDLAFDLFPPSDAALSVAEYVIMAQVIGVAILLFVHRYRVIIFRRLCLILGVLYLFRAICMASTQLPIANKNYYCSPQIYNASNHESPSFGKYIGIIASRVFYMSMGMGLSINGRHSYCGDYMYSGHTVILTLAYLIVREYLIPLRCRTLMWKVFNTLLLASSLIGVICIIISRGHYFIDIVVAYFVTTRIFWIYHTLCYNNALRSKSLTNYLSRVWWWPLFKYFEDTHMINCPAGSGRDGRHCNCCDSPLPQVPRSFEWPLPWPRTLRKRSRGRRTQRLLPTQQP